MKHWNPKLRAWMPGMSLRARVIVLLACAVLFMAAATQIDLTTQVKGTLPEANGGTNQSTYTLGDLLYSSATNTLSKLAGNTTTTNKFLCQTGTGSISAAPAWCALIAGDIPNLDASKITTGTVSTARLGSGTANGTTYLRGDQTWQTIPASANFADNETPSGTINSSNTTFTLANSPSPALSLQLYRNGQLQIAAGADFTLTGNSISFVSAPKTGDVLRASYRY